MRYRLLVVALAVAGVGIAALAASRRPAKLASPTAPPANGKLQVDPAAVDFGTALPGALKRVEFRLTNTGAAPLTVTELRSSCGCAPASIDKERIAPGEQAVIAIDYRLPTSAGLAAKSVSFRTDDPERPFATLPFQALVEYPVQANPSAIAAGAVLVNTAASYDLELFSSDAGHFEVLRVETSSPRVEALPCGQPARHRRKYRVTLRAGPEPSGIAESIKFVTSASAFPEVVVPVAGQAVGASSVSPTSLLLKSTPAGGSAAGSLVLRSNAVTLDRVTAVKMLTPGWAIESWESVASGPSACRLALTIRVPAEAGYKRATLAVVQGEGAVRHEVIVTCLVRAPDGAR